MDSVIIVQIAVKHHVFKMLREEIFVKLIVIIAMMIFKIYVQNNVDGLKIQHKCSNLSQILLLMMIAQVIIKIYVI